MACVIKVDAECALPNGEKLVRGTLKMSTSYPAGGDPINLANYFTNARVPTVVVASCNGYCLQWVGSDAYTGNIKASMGGINGINCFEAIATTSLNCINTGFYAIGPAY
jgi:hypothetical protein